MRPVPPPAIVRKIEFDVCTCPECRRLDREFPGQGQQLALFRYQIQLRRR